MDIWHPLGSRDELLARVPYATKLDRHRIAVFHHDGALHAIADRCNHRGGPSHGLGIVVPRVRRQLRQGEPRLHLVLRHQPQVRGWRAHLNGRGPC